MLKYGRTTLQNLLLKDAGATDCLLGLDQLEPVNLLILPDTFTIISFIDSLVCKRLRIQIVVSSHLSAFVTDTLFNLLSNDTIDVREVLRRLQLIRILDEIVDFGTHVAASTRLKLSAAKLASAASLRLLGSLRSLPH